MKVTVNSNISGSSIVQGNTFQWQITGFSPSGSTVSNQIWVDVDSNGVIDPAKDFLFVSFNQTDGMSGNNGPGDMDGIANDTISTTIGGLYFPISHYIFKTNLGSNSAEANYNLTPMIPPITFSVTGKVTKNGIGVGNITIKAGKFPDQSNSIQYYALTDSNGNYSLPTKLANGDSIYVEVPFDGSSFNSNLVGEIVSPSRLTFVINSSSVSNINFTIQNGKLITGVVTDSLTGKPIPNLMVDAYHPNGGNGTSTYTDSLGKYFLTVDTGYYQIQFGSVQQYTGYVITYYNHTHIGWNSDSVHVTASIDTLKNINAQLIKGGLITGTFLNNGKAAQGNISASLYNNNSRTLYNSWHDTSNGSGSSTYYLVVPPGVYSISFSLNNPNGNYIYAFYNQTYSSPGTAITVNAVTDTIKNINIDFGTIPLPKSFNFFGNGNWTVSNNWNNGLIPPNPLPAGDTVYISSWQSGGKCIMNLGIPYIVSPGAVFVVNSNSNLVIPGYLKLD